MSRQPSVHALPGPLAMTLRLSPVFARMVMLAAAALLTGLLLLLFRDPLHILEERVGAEAWKLGPAGDVEQRVTLVAIDERSLARVGPWPWPRETLAELSLALQAAGSQLQVYDIVFPENRPGDEALIAALRQGNSILAQVPVLDARQSLQAGQLDHAMAGVNCAAAGASTQNYLANHSGFAGISKGHITPRVDSDGGVRQVPAWICIEGSAYPALALSAMMQAVGSAEQGWSVNVRDGEGLLAPARSLELDAYPGLSVPLDAEGNIRVSYAERPENFRALSAIDVLEGNVDPELLANTWTLVGATAFGLGDVVPTPYSGTTPGVELQARLLVSLLDNAVPHEPRRATLMQSAQGLAFAALLLLLVSHRRHRVAVIGLPLAGVLLPLVSLALHSQLLLASGIWLGWLAPAFYALLASGLLFVLEHSRVRLEHNRVYDTLNRYLPADVARDVAYSLPSSEVDARRETLTLFSADLRNFSAYTEARPPEESAALLHRFFSLATEIVERLDGRVHEFRGDGLLAVWNGNESGVRQALRAAEEMQTVIARDLLPATAPEGLEPLGLGIGIEQGAVLIGSIGPANRRTHTLLGDTVAITLRIQEMTAELALPILLGEMAARHLPGELNSQGRYLLSGLRVPQTLFAPGTQASPAPTQAPSLAILQGGRH